MPTMRHHPLQAQEPGLVHDHATVCMQPQNVSMLAGRGVPSTLAAAWATIKAPEAAAIQTTTHHRRQVRAARRRQHSSRAASASVAVHTPGIQGRLHQTAHQRQSASVQSSSDHSKRSQGSTAASQAWSADTRKLSTAAVQHSLSSRSQVGSSRAAPQPSCQDLAQLRCWTAQMRAALM